MKLFFRDEARPWREMEKVYFEGEKAVSAAMDHAAVSLKQEWRRQVRDAGLGARLANTIRDASYPVGTVSMNAAALVWSKAPHIVSAYNEGSTIRSQDGFWLAIPTPAAGKGARGRKITPVDFEQRTGRRLRFVYRNGRSALLVLDDARLTKRGLARAKGGRRRKDGILTGAQTVVVFVLVPQVRVKKRLDLEAGADKIAAQVPGWIVNGWKD